MKEENNVDLISYILLYQKILFDLLSFFYWIRGTVRLIVTLLVKINNVEDIFVYLGLK